MSYIIVHKKEKYNLYFVNFHKIYPTIRQLAKQVGVCGAIRQLAKHVGICGAIRQLTGNIGIRLFVV